MPQAATLSVKIAADINDFGRNLDKAERQFVRAAQRITAVGKDLTLSVTAPFIALSAAIAKSAADDAQSVAKLQRTFGSGAQAMEAWIQRLMKTVPATDDALRRLAVGTDTMLRSMGFGTAAAARMTQSVTQLAGDLAAYNHVEIGVAQDALEKALAGKTRGLQEFGIVLNQNEIKLTAYRLGIAKWGTELTSAQTAEAAWAAILERSKLQQGEAARTIDDAANALPRLKQAADNLADSFGAVVLPTAAKVVDKLAQLAQAAADLPASTKGAIVGFGAIAAATGPVIIALGTVTENVVRLRRALVTLDGASALGGLATVGATLALVAAPLAAIAHAFLEEGRASRDAATALDQYKASLAGMSKQQLAGELAKDATQVGALTTKWTQLKTELDRLNDPKNYDVANAGRIDKLNTAIAATSRELGVAASRFGAAKDALGAFTAAAGGGGGGGGGGNGSTKSPLEQMAEDAKNLAGIFKDLQEQWAKPFAERTLGTVIAQAAVLDARLRQLLATVAVGSTEQAQILGTLGALQPIFAPLPITAPGIGNSITRPTANVPFGGVPQSLITGDKDPFTPAGVKFAAALDGIREKMGGAFDRMIEVLGQGFAAIIAKGLGVQTGGFGSQFLGLAGQGAGAALSTLGGLGVAGAAFGSVVFPVIGTAIGSLIGGGLDKLFGGHKRHVDDSASALDKLASAADKATEALLNAPQGFKVAYARFQAANAQTLATGGGSGRGSTGGTGGGQTGSTGGSQRADVAAGGLTITGDVHVYGVTDVPSLIKELGREVQRQATRGGFSPLALGVAR